MPNNDDFVIVIPEHLAPMVTRSAIELATIVETGQRVNHFRFSHIVKGRAKRGYVYSVRDITLDDMRDIVILIEGMDDNLLLISH